jgi:radical SAM superfamily enzyme
MTQRELTQLRIVEETGPRMFGLEESDVMERRGYVNYVKQEIEVGRAECFIRRRLTIHRKDRLLDPNWKLELRRLAFAFPRHLYEGSEGTLAKAKTSIFDYTPRSDQIKSTSSHT